MKKFIKEVGGWIAIAIFITLAAFYITLYITKGDVKTSVMVNFIVVLGLFFITFSISARKLSTASTGAFVIGLVALVVFLGFPQWCVILVLAWLTTIFAFVVAGDVKDNPDIRDINKKAIWFSYALEFVIIFILVLGPTLHWF